MAPDRDVGAFDERAAVYEIGWRGRLHYRIADEVAHLAVRLVPNAERVLDVGAGRATFGASWRKSFRRHGLCMGSMLRPE